MNSSMSLPVEADQLHLSGESVRSMRHGLHELANVFTGVMIAAGLLSEYLEGGSLQTYATDISEGSERGKVLVQELRNQLLAAYGEGELPPSISPAGDSVRGSGNSAEG